MKLLIQKAILANILLFIGYSLSAGEIKIKIDSITRMIPKTKFNPPQHLCAAKKHILWQHRTIPA